MAILVFNGELSLSNCDGENTRRDGITGFCAGVVVCFCRSAIASIALYH